jgi:hypothetical protein
MQAPLMKADTQMIHISDELTVPWDLRQWFDAATLRGWIDEEIGTLDWDNPQVVEYLRQRPGFQPRVLLRLLTYAYATAVFESDDIARRAGADPDYTAIAGSGWRMEGPGLTRFRRENRGLLKWTLVQLLKRALRARLGEFMLPAGLKRRLVDAAVTRIDLGRQMDRGYDGL